MLQGNVHVALADEKAILLAKKKMLAELELSCGTSIIVNNTEVTKNDIIVYIDNLLQTGNLAYHAAIAEDTVLLDFLQKGILTPNKKFKNAPLYSNEAFIEWVTPYFFTSFSHIATTSFIAGDDFKWRILMNTPLLMNAGAVEAAWQEIEDMVENDLAEIEEFIRHEGAGNRDIVTSLSNFKYINMLVQLPVNRFTPLRDNYARAVLTSAVHIFSKVNRGLGRTMVENALLIAVSEDIKTALKAEHAEMENIIQRAYSKSSRRGVWGGLIIAAVFYFLLFRLTMCGTEKRGTGEQHTGKQATTPLADTRMAPQPILPLKSTMPGK